jgi:hypothetical protein
MLSIELLALPVFIVVLSFFQLRFIFLFIFLSSSSSFPTRPRQKTLEWCIAEISGSSIRPFNFSIPMLNEDRNGNTFGEFTPVEVRVGEKGEVEGRPESEKFCFHAEKSTQCPLTECCVEGGKEGRQTSTQFFALFEAHEWDFHISFWYNRIMQWDVSHLRLP